MVVSGCDRREGVVLGKGQRCVCIGRLGSSGGRQRSMGVAVVPMGLGVSV